VGRGISMIMKMNSKLASCELVFTAEMPNSNAEALSYDNLHHHVFVNQSQQVVMVQKFEKWGSI
ncbi:hypothetical protein TNCV_566911, partial [Trichonephila clavipes]